MLPGLREPDIDMDDALQYTAFIDLMGFADGQEALADEDAHRLACVMSGEWLLHPELSNAAKTLYVRYSRFHEWFDETTREVSEDLTLRVSFSDSGFIAASNRGPILRIAAQIIQKCYNGRIPIRIGIGRGTVGRATFSSTFASGRLSAQSQFFGTGIVRSYRAQSCEAKGFRVFLHSSAEMPKDEEQAWLLPRLDKDEKAAGCVRELNFMYRGERGNDHDWLYLNRALDDMRDGVTSHKALLHYDASARALKRFEDLLLMQFGADGTILIVDPLPR